MNAYRLSNAQVWGLLCLVLSIVFGVAVFRSNIPAAKADEKSKAPSGDSNIARGKYLVHHVAQCVQCHTPRDERGVLIESKLLQGAPIPIKGPHYAQPWAAESAWIAGLGNYDAAFVRYLLTHGRKPDGSAPKRPMPTFKMNDDDANAVIAYLQSL